jgi:hypothetical protein
MNERIKLLADQAYEDFQTPTSPKYLVFNKEKFAELIVRECLTQADALRDSFESEGEDQQSLGAAWVGLAIARHFGVE